MPSIPKVQSLWRIVINFRAAHTFDRASGANADPLDELRVPGNSAFSPMKRPALDT
jgi:hypothetical protein